MQATTPVLERLSSKLFSFAAASAIALSLAAGTATSALADSEGEDSITVSGSIVPTITLELPQNVISYGDLTPNDTGASGASVTGAVDVNGTTYTYASAGSVRVESNAAWTGAVEADLTGASLLTSDLSLVSDGGSQAFGSTLAFGTKTPGISTYAHNYAVRVDWVDATGAFNATILYSVTNG